MTRYHGSSYAGRHAAALSDGAGVFASAAGISYAVAPVRARAASPPQACARACARARLRACACACACRCQRVCARRFFRLGGCRRHISQAVAKKRRGREDGGEEGGGG